MLNSVIVELYFDAVDRRGV